MTKFAKRNNEMEGSNEGEIMGEVAKIQKLGEDLVIVFPKEVIEKLNLEEGCLVEIESFICSGTSGIRIKPKTDAET